MVAMVMPLSDGMDIHFTSLHKILRNLYDQMTPLTDDIATFATAVAGLGALLYISYRVWQALARADAIDVFSLLRPFVIGLCIIGFRPIVVNSINGILKPLVVGTNHILKDQLLDMKELQKKKDRLEWEEAVRRKTYGVIDPNEDYDAELRALGLDVPTQSVMDTLYEVTHIFSTKYWVLQLFRWLLEILFGAAALVIDTPYQVQNEVELLKHSLYVCVVHNLLMFNGLPVFMLYILPNLRAGHEPAKLCCGMAQPEVVGYIFFLFGSSKRQFQTADIIGPKFLL